ncbi:hypothetical protein [Mycoplasmoides pirum]|uniref:hypothetical protein n=1 Tax=Mycoplasmoides pirum TaxID=2122 RepID=UPI0004826733|nr:hypothetical protein [Mycoplasmoides pirum]
MYNKKFFLIIFAFISLMFFIGFCLIISYCSSSVVSITNQEIQRLSTLSSIGGSFIIIGCTFGLVISLFHAGLAYLVFQKRNLNSNYLTPFVFNLISFVFWFMTSVIGLFAITNGNFFSQIVDLNLISSSTNLNIFGGFKSYPTINDSNWAGYFGSDMAFFLLSFVLFFITRKKYLNFNAAILSKEQSNALNQNLTKES